MLFLVYSIRDTKMLKGILLVTTFSKKRGIWFDILHLNMNSRYIQNTLVSLIYHGIPATLVLERYFQNLL